MRWQPTRTRSRNPAFKADLDVKIIKGLSLVGTPAGYALDGKLVFEDNPKKDKAGNVIGKPVTGYIVWDRNQSAPLGFGVRIPSHMNSRIDDLLPHRWQLLG